MGPGSLTNQQKRAHLRDRSVSTVSTDPTAELTGAPGPDVGKALRSWDQHSAAVLLAHQPNVLKQAAEHGVDSQLSGHTHGGQMFPFHPLLALTHDAKSGPSRLGNTQLYVSNGVGFWELPVRVGAPPEVTIIELASAE